MNRPLVPHVFVLTLALVALTALVFTTPAQAKRKGGPSFDADGPTESQLAVRQLRQQIAAEELLIALGLDAEQEAALTALVTRVVEEREAKQAQREADAPKLEALLEDYLTEVQKNGSPSDGTVRALRAFREERRPDHEAMRGQREQVREELKSILGEPGMQALAGFRPMEDVGPTEEEREARRSERREHRAEKLERRAEELDRDPPSPEEMERMDRKRHERGERHHARRIVRDVLFSRAMLDALTR